MRTQGGFTLIELVMVIVILGILAATAVPALTDLDSSARQAAVEGVAGALGSASAVNYAVRSVDPAKGITVNGCEDVSGALEGATPIADFTITVSAAPIAAGTTAECTVTHNGGTESAKFIAHGIS